jgi:hypothetical protein
VGVGWASVGEGAGGDVGDAGAVGGVVGDGTAAGVCVNAGSFVSRSVVVAVGGGPVGGAVGADVPCVHAASSTVSSKHVHSLVGRMAIPRSLLTR